MRKAIKYFIGLALSIFLALPVFSEEKIFYQDRDLDLLLHDIKKPQAPFVTDDYIIFTCDSNYRYAGIAFDFENYQTVHPFEVFTSVDDEDVKTRDFMFYVYKRQHKFTTIKYRLVFDGLWTADPLNPHLVYDDNVNLYFSVVEDPGSVRVYTSNLNDDSVHFIYKGTPGETVHLSGTFTKWDPWIYELEETSPGFYELELPLTTGEYYYTYYIGMNPIYDNTNPNKIYTPDGRIASVITVD